MTSPQAHIQIEALKVSFTDPDGAKRTVLDIPSLTINKGRQLCLVGDSGSGKTTLLNIIAGITTPTSGKVTLDGVEITALDEARRDKLRAERVGYVFQTFNLLPQLTCLENVALALTLAGQSVAEARQKAAALLKEMGLGHRLNAATGRMSVGERQRAAIARALVGNPSVVLADEPTANLDAANSDKALTLLRQMSAERGSTLLLVTHQRRVQDLFDDVLKLEEVNR